MLAAAGQPHAPSLLVADAEFQFAVLAVGDGGQCGFDHSAFDAAAGYRAQKAAIVAHRDLAAGRTRRRTPGPDHRAERDFPACSQPGSRIVQFFAHTESFCRRTK